MNKLTLVIKQYIHISKHYFICHIYGIIYIAYTCVHILYLYLYCICYTIHTHQIDRQMDRQIDRQIDRYTHTNTYTHTHTHTHTYIYVCVCIYAYFVSYTSFWNQVTKGVFCVFNYQVGTLLFILYFNNLLVKLTLIFIFQSHLT